MARSKPAHKAEEVPAKTVRLVKSKDGTSYEKQGEVKFVEDVYNVSQSKIKTYRRCKFAYHMRYVEKLRRKRKSRPLMFGTIVHEMVEAHANGDDPFARLDAINLKDMKLFAQEREEYGNLIEDIRCIMGEYFNYWDDDQLAYQRINKRAAEHEFNIPLATGIMLNGKIDAVARTPNKLRWIVEHKSFAKRPNEDQRWRSMQSAVYVRVVDTLGWKPVDGTAWDYIRSKPPSVPQLLKSGDFGKKTIDTLPSRLIEWSKAEKVTIPKHIMESAEKNRDQYFFRVFSPVKAALVDSMMRDVIETAQEMAENHGKRCAKTIDQHCSWCDYESICRAELTGGDVDFVKKREYDVSSRPVETREAE